MSVQVGGEEMPSHPAFLAGDFERGVEGLATEDVEEDFSTGLESRIDALQRVLEYLDQRETVEPVTFGGDDAALVETTFVPTCLDGRALVFGAGFDGEHGFPHRRAVQWLKVAISADGNPGCGSGRRAWS